VIFFFENPKKSNVKIGFTHSFIFGVEKEKNNCRKWERGTYPISSKSKTGNNPSKSEDFGLFFTLKI